LVGSKNAVDRLKFLKVDLKVGSKMLWKHFHIIFMTLVLLASEFKNGKLLTIGSKIPTIVMKNQNI